MQEIPGHGAGESCCSVVGFLALGWVRHGQGHVRLTWPGTISAPGLARPRRPSPLTRACYPGQAGRTRASPCSRAIPGASQDAV
jgi:hypothetical protein